MALVYKLNLIQKIIYLKKKKKKLFLKIKKIKIKNEHLLFNTKIILPLKYINEGIIIELISSCVYHMEYPLVHYIIWYMPASTSTVGE